MIDGYVYLASPYSHPDPEVRTRRFMEVCRIAARLMEDQKLVVFCPIAMNHPIAEIAGLPRNFEYWRRYDEVMLRGSQMLIAACMDGWRESVGVQAEIEIAQEAGIPIHYLCASCVRSFLDDQVPHVCIEEEL